MLNEAMDRTKGIEYQWTNINNKLGNWMSSKSWALFEIVSVTDCIGGGNGVGAYVPQNQFNVAQTIKTHG